MVTSLQQTKQKKTKIAHYKILGIYLKGLRDTVIITS